MLITTPRTYHRQLEVVVKEGQRVAPRGEQTYEFLNSTLFFRSPRDRIVQDPARRMNVAFGVAEFASLVGAIDDIDFFKQFIATYDKYSSDGKTLDGCYGTRIGGLHAISSVVAQLAADVWTRRAVIPIYDIDDLLNGKGGKNTPCTLSLQFLVRDLELDLFTTMRSSDMVKGVTYDLFVFTLLQELIASIMGLDVGVYSHNAGSLHVYEADIPMIKKMGYAKRWPHLMNPMPSVIISDVETFVALALAINDVGVWFKLATDKTMWSSEDAQIYFVTLAAVMMAFVCRKDDVATALRAYNMINDQSLRHAVRPWMKAAGVVYGGGVDDVA